MVGKKRVKTTTVKSSIMKNTKKKPSIKKKPIKHKVRSKLKKKELKIHKVRHRRHTHKRHVAHAGINLLAWYVITLVLCYILYFFTRIIKPEIYPGSVRGMIVVDAVMIIALLFMIKGFYTRPSWVYHLSLWWFALSIPYSIFSMYYLRAGLFDAARGLFFLALLFMILINGFIIWYLLKKKTYLTDPKAALVIDYHDKVFIYVMVTLWVVLVLLSIVIGTQLYNDKKELAEDVMLELEPALRENDKETAITFCQNSHGERKDMCYLVLTNAYREYFHFCDKISSDMYKFLCLQSIA